LQIKSEYIEEDAAKAVGFILFEFARLDMNLGLCLVWSDEGRNLEELTKKISEKNFNSRLNLLEKLAFEKYESDSTELIKYKNWMYNANNVRILRNQLVHGRWGFIPHQGCVANVTGLPTSPEQSEVRYTIKQLNRVVKRIQNLSTKLNTLREECAI